MMPSTTTTTRVAAAAVVIAAIASSAVAQKLAAYPGSCGLEQDTFDTCIARALVDATSQQYQTVEQFCNGLVGNPMEYLKCECDGYSRVVVCYQNNCQTDTTKIVDVFNNSKTNYCSQLQAAVPTTSAAAASPAATSAGAAAAPTSANVAATSAPVLPNPGGAGSTASSTTTAATGKTGSAASSVKAGGILAFVAAFVLIL